ncbi:MAG: hypothetical protein IJJ47_09210 [Methanosphaera sp.]|nr:hypothetical protein [Methanosphaera sp.]
MSEFDMLYKDEFFIIDSYNLNTVKSKLYGYAIIGDRIVTNEEYCDETLSGNGVYVCVKKFGDKIQIFQDFNGSYGIYLFRKGDYFAISNSFIKLVEYVKYNYQISLNEDYANMFLSASLVSISSHETLINEIESIPRNAFIEIDLISKKMDVKYIDYNENTIELDSKEAITLIDEWFYKWISIIRNLKQKTNNLIVDITGGFDTRSVLLLFLNANVNFEEILFNSVNNNVHTFSEDFKIATILSEKFDFKLNDDANLNIRPKFFNELNTTINVSFYPKLGFHKQMFYKNFKFNKYVYSFTGGGTLRNYGNVEENIVVEKYLKTAGSFHPSMISSTKKIISNEYENYKNNFNNTSFGRYMIKKTRDPNHYGKSNVESFLINNINLNPLFDTKLYKIRKITEECGDSSLLYSLILIRFCPELLEIKFDNEKNISQETINYARTINEKYPLIINDLEKISCNNIQLNETNTENIYEKGLLYTSKCNEIEEYFKKIILTNNFKNKIEQYFSPEIYSKIIEYMEKNKYFPLSDAYAAIAILKIIDDINFSNNTLNKPIIYWLNNFKSENYNYDLISKESYSLLFKYNTLRMDIKNYGKKDNSLVIESSSDDNLLIEQPKWNTNELGKGLMLHSLSNKLKIKIKCINRGTFKLFLRSRDYIKNGKRIPIFINLSKIVVNDKKILNKSEVINYDSPYFFEKNVENNEIVEIEINWLPL